MRKCLCNNFISRVGINLGLVTLLSLGGSQVFAQDSDAMDQMVKNARANGMLAKVLYIVFTQGIPGAKLPEGVEDQQQMMTMHLDYQKKLEKEGIMFGAGPFSAEGNSAQGMIVIRANSEEEARAIADADPMHKFGQREYKLGRWQVNEGTVTVRVNFSNGTYEFE